MTETPQTGRKYGTVRKVGQVLGLFSVTRPEWGVNEVAEGLKIPKSTTSEFMSALEDEGLLRRTGARRYRLGWRIVSMNQVLVDTEFRTEARRAMEYLASRSGATVHLAALERGQVIHLDKVQGAQAAQISSTDTGSTFPAHATGVGKVLLAYRPWEEVVEILSMYGMPAFTPNTITTLETLHDELRCVREQKYAYNLEEGVPRLSCVAVPVKDLTGEIVASLSLSVSTYQFHSLRDRFRHILLSTARTMSDNVGHVQMKLNCT